MEEILKKYTPVIGLEVHVELKTNSKMFCGCDANYFGEKPNTHTCPVCLGLPGALPVPNKKAIDWCIMIGMALNCEISLVSKFDRKNYFYPDLPKGYQISQYDEPFCTNGWVELSNGKKIGITRVHMEEDTGKLIHEHIDGNGVSLIDFNRSGVPLVEIVTEPDFDSAEDVKEYLQRLQQIVRYLGVSNADMDKGDMRLEPNISLRKVGETKLPPYKVEVKNINSFSFVEKAINFEIKRHAEILDTGTYPMQETRGFIEAGSKTVGQRSKEEAHDYRYFPEPDIPPIEFSKEEIAALMQSMPELPDAKKERFIKQYALSAYNADLLTRDKALADFFEICCEDSGLVSVHPEPTHIANWLINRKVDITKYMPADVIMQIIEASRVAGVDVDELDDILKKVLEENPEVVTSYKAGKTNVLMFLLGQAMKSLKGREKPEIIKEKLEKLLA